MMKKILIAVSAVVFLLLPCSQTDAAKLMGIEEKVWEEDLQALAGEYVFADDFLVKVSKSADSLNLKYSGEHFEKIGGRHETVREKRRRNPLLQKKQSVRSKFLLDLNLDKNDYYKLLSYIPYLNNYYSENHIALILPYLAMCLRYEVPESVINFQVSNMVRHETPPDIACERLYRIAVDEMSWS